MCLERVSINQSSLTAFHFLFIRSLTISTKKKIKREIQIEIA